MVSALNRNPAVAVEPMVDIHAALRVVNFADRAIWPLLHRAAVLRFVGYNPLRSRSARHGCVGRMGLLTSRPTLDRSGSARMARPRIRAGLGCSGVRISRTGVSGGIAGSRTGVTRRVAGGGTSVRGRGIAGSHTGVPGRIIGGWAGVARRSAGGCRSMCGSVTGTSCRCTS